MREMLAKHWTWLNVIKWLFLGQPHSDNGTSVTTCNDELCTPGGIAGAGNAKSINLYDFFEDFIFLSFVCLHINKGILSCNEIVKVGCSICPDIFLCSRYYLANYHKDHLRYIQIINRWHKPIVVHVNDYNDMD